MRHSSVVTSFVVLVFVVIVNQVDESQGIIIPIIKPDLRFLMEKKKTLLSFLNMQAILQMLGQIINLGAVMQHFGLAPAPPASAVQKGSGSTNQMTVVPPPMSGEDSGSITAADGMEDCTEAEGELMTEVSASEQEHYVKDRDPQESREEATSTEITADSNNGEEDDNEETEVVTDQNDDAETTTATSDEVSANEIGSIEIGLRRRKLDNIRKRYLLSERRAGIY